ncbi:MAG: tyrosine-type recombinase/integrase [Clostridiales bacterium]|nr:tyrosine-type recombinase/integrase [Clostridiales bacterium]
MKEKIYFKDLTCYKNADENTKNHPQIYPDRCFILTKVPTISLRNELESFIMYRGEILTPLSMREDFYVFNQLCSVLNEYHESLKSFKDITKEELLKDAQKWLIKNGKKVSHIRTKTITGEKELINAVLIKYINLIYRYIYRENEIFNYESDIWNLNNIPIELKRNPVKNIKTLSFARIKQEGIKQEIKQIVYYNLSYKALGTVSRDMAPIVRFCNFLLDRHSEVRSLKAVDRKMIEEYMIYVNTEIDATDRDIIIIRNMFLVAAWLLNDEKLSRLFLEDDNYGRRMRRQVIVYSDDEIKRFNRAIVELDGQVARALIIHQLLGTRISETLTLKRDNVYANADGRWMVRLTQIKTRRTYEKPINEDVKKLIEAACSYTTTKFGMTEYIFVDESKPNEPMKYSRIQYHLTKLIRVDDLRDDNGNAFKPRTHIWRHSYGKRLTELHIDDITIAKLLGHANTASLSSYRRVGNKMLADATRPMRNAMDEILADAMSRW